MQISFTQDMTRLDDSILHPYNHFWTVRYSVNIQSHWPPSGINPFLIGWKYPKWLGVISPCFTLIRIWTFHAGGRIFGVTIICIANNMSPLNCMFNVCLCQESLLHQNIAVLSPRILRLPNSGKTGNWPQFVIQTVQTQIHHIHSILYICFNQNTITARHVKYWYLQGDDSNEFCLCRMLIFDEERILMNCPGCKCCYLTGRQF